MPETKWDMSDYVPVNERIEAFKKDWPDGSLQSTIVELTDTRVTVKAFAYRTADDLRPGIGHSSVVIPGSTPYTRGSEIENAETSAWGRAIAALGFEVKRGLASREEVRNKQPGQAPKTEAQPRPKPASAELEAGDGLPTPALLASRYAWAVNHGWAPDHLDAAAVSATGKAVSALDSLDWQIFASTIKDGPSTQPATGTAGEEAAVDSPPAAASTSKKGRTTEEAIAAAEAKATAAA